MAKLILVLASVLLILAGFWMLRDQHTKAVKEKSFVASPKTVPSLNTSISPIPSPISTPISKAGQSKIQQQIYNRLSQWHNKPIEQVVQECEAALEKNPEDVATLFKLGQVYLASPQKRELAYQHFAKILELSPNHPQKEFLEMWTKVVKGTEKAKLLVDKINRQKQKVEQNPRIVAEYVELAQCYREIQSFPMAIHTYKKAMELEPENVEFYFQLGTLVKEQIIYQAMACEGHTPENPARRKMRKELYKSLCQEGIDYFHKVLQLKPEHACKAEIIIGVQALEQKLQNLDDKRK